MGSEDKGKSTETRHNLFKTFVVTLALSLAIVGAVSFHIASGALERNMVERAKHLMAGVVREQLGKGLGDVDLSVPLAGAALERFDARADRFNFGPEVLHIKIWNRAMTVVWSERTELIGESSPGNKELAEALAAGRVVSEINEGSKYDWEQGLPARILEVYIPVRFDDRGAVLTVAEVYQDLVPLSADVAHHRAILLTVTICGFATLFLVLSLIVWRGSRKIDEQARQLRRSYEEISAARDEWEATFDTIGEAITVHDRDFTIVRANKEAKRLLGISGNEGLKCFELYHGADAPPDNCVGRQVLVDGNAVKGTNFEPHLGRHMETNTFARRGADNAIVGLVHVVRDVTREKRIAEDREKLKLQLVHAQRMESVGRMAGGIAHDFNNLLCVIQGCGEVLRAGLPAGDPRLQHVEAIEAAGAKGGDLTRQLLAFSRQQVLEMKRIDLNEVVEQMAVLLRRTVAGNIALDVRISPSACSAVADRVQIEQVLLNLVVNARDATPEGGRIVVETGNVVLGGEDRADTGGAGREGRFVVLAVSDSGAGIPPQIQERIFEPFFSTKEEGKGTGLGLATVYGIVKQHEGFITLTSEPGRGAAFKVFLPAADRAGLRDPAAPGGPKRLLLVEDDATICALLGATLAESGYLVTTAASGEAALAAIDGHADFDLLLSDTVLPGMSGVELARAVRARGLGMKVILISAYTEALLSRFGRIEEEFVILRKPLAPAQLLDAIASTLGGG